MDSSLQKLVDEWLRIDQEPTTRAEIKSLLADDNVHELQKRLSKRIAFGTAGLRGTMAAGFSCMNCLTVIQASQGLAAYLLKTESDVQTRGVVIGRDARYNSDKFARLTAAAFMAKGISVKWLGQVHTPLVPYTVGHLNAVAGVMVTASHNPAVDNGYKVYWSNGCQIIPPHDSGIATSIDNNLEPVTWDSSVVNPDNPLFFEVLHQVEEGYTEAVAKNAQIHHGQPSQPFVYTPMHGVGLPFFISVLKTMGLQDKMHVVEDQAKPDPSFPTVRFPNPEEKGALDLAKQVAQKAGIKLILANDPDADRFAVAEEVDGTWKQLTGNQIGVLLAAHVLENYEKKSSGKGLAMLASTVSSRMLASMAEVEKNFHWEETLTGFKWLGNRARDLQNQGYDALYAYEEAIGFMFSNIVFDKDGIAAAAVFLSACNQWNEQGMTPWGKYLQLCKKYGNFEDANTYVISPSSDVTNRVFGEIRQSKPSHVGRRRILRWRDLTEGFDSGTSDNKPILPVDKSSQMLTCELEGSVHFTVRGSGTEPKIKFYIEGKADTVDEAKRAANEVLDDLMTEWFKPEENGLKRE